MDCRSLAQWSSAYHNWISPHLFAKSQSEQAGGGWHLHVRASHYIPRTGGGRPLDMPQGTSSCCSEQCPQWNYEWLGPPVGATYPQTGISTPSRFQGWNRRLWEHRWLGVQPVRSLTTPWASRGQRRCFTHQRAQG